MHPNELAIGDYVDGTLAAGERADVERHLSECVACRSLIESLRGVRDAARTLEPMTPPPAAWARIAETIARESRLATARDAGGPVRIMPMPPLPASAWRARWGWLAAVVALVIATGAGLWLRAPGNGQRQAPQATAAAPAGQTATADSVEAELKAAEEHYQRAITGLEQIANSEKGSLDPDTAAALQKNLTVIDQAISESRAALRTEPNSAPAQESLLDSFKTKLSLLEDTVALINEMRKGNDEGAARAASGLRPKG